MTSCTTCGHELGEGRFCTRCGTAVDEATPSFDDWRTDTAERAVPRVVVPPAAPATPSAVPSGPSAGPPTVPPSASAPPPPPRYPLYADEVDAWGGPAAPAVPEPEPEPAPVWAAQDAEPAEEWHHDQEWEEERRSPVLWILVTAVVLVLVAAGWWFLVRDDSAGSATDRGGAAAQSADAGDGSGGSGGTDVARRATAEAPSTAPPNQDVDGKQVSYDASNMLDGVAATAWRTEGDAAGMELRFTLPEPTELVRVGIINGYAKKATDDQGRTVDWYRGNRRVTAVVWAFDDGTKVRQKLGEDPRLQTLDLPAPVTTTTVVLTLARVSAPGEGDAGRDFTAVSEVSLTSPAGS